MQLTVKVDGKAHKASYSSSANHTPSLLTAGAKDGATLTHTPVEDVRDAFSHANAHAATHTPTLDGHRLPSMHHAVSNERVAFIPKPQLILFWSNITLFILCIGAVVLGILGIAIDSVLIASQKCWHTAPQRI